ncbi:hypothetical protein QUF64_11300 [Anaerolineales bacterium HSG6]|nr:hypothetical protein [Anaerolineales bacterium HSG6]
MKIFQSNYQQRLIQSSILITFVVLGVIATLTLPLSSGEDEVAHFRFGRFIAHHQRLPLTLEERNEADYKSDLPSLFYMVFGLTGSWLDLDAPPQIKISGDNPRLKLLTALENASTARAIDTADPLQGEQLLWRIGRWVALGAALLTLLLVYRLIRLLWPESTWLALSATAMLAFLPAYFSNSVVISYESLLGLCMTAYFLLLFQTLKQPDRNWPYVGLGGLLGLACLSKYTPVPLILFLPLLIIWLAHRHSWSIRVTVIRIGLTGLAFTLTFGLWIGFTLLYFNQIAEQGLVLGTIATFLASDGSDETSMRLINIASDGASGIKSTSHSDSFADWLRFLFTGLVNESWLIWLLGPLILLAIIGLGRQWSSYDSFTRLWLTTLILHGLLLLSLPLLRFIMTSQATPAVARHVLFPGAVLFVLLLLYGLRYWFSVVRLSWLLGCLALFMFSQQTYNTYHQTVTLFPVQTVPLANETVLAHYEGLSLLRQKVSQSDEFVTLDLWWRGEAFLPADYRLEAMLLDQNQELVAKWLGQPLNGRYPTRTWFPNDRIQTRMQIPIVGLPADIYHLQLGLLSDQYSLINPLQGEHEAGRLPIADLALKPAPYTPAKVINWLGESIGYTVWHGLLPHRTGSRYQEWATIYVSTTTLPKEMSLHLVGPDNQPHAPLYQTGTTAIFEVKPQFADGDYRLRFAQADSIVDTPSLLTVETEDRQFVAGPFSTPVEANFANQLQLLGYDLPQRTAQAGAGIPLTMHWQANRNIGADLIFFNHLIGPDGQAWGGQDRVPQDVYSTLLWASGEVVADSFIVKIDPLAPPGTYQLLVGVYLPVAEAVSLPLVQNGQLSDITHVNLGSIEVVSAD